MGGDVDMKISIKQLKEIMGTKVYLEHEQYRLNMLKNNSEEIYNLAYQIDCHINIYEYLLIISETATEEELATIINYPDFIDYVYEEWLKTDYDDLYEFIKDFVREETRKEFQKEAA